MKKYLLPEQGKFYKANLHTHTTVSDGHLTPLQVKELYKKNGYSILAYTDHEVMTPHNDLADEDFLPITSYEISTNEEGYNDFGFIRTYHINLYAKDPNNTVSPVWTARKIWPGHALEYASEEQKKVEFNRYYSVDKINEIIRVANENGFLVCYNHPVWSLQNYTDYGELKGLWGVEVYNTGCVHEGFPDTEQPLDDLLRKGENVFPIAADDMHNPKDACGGWTMIKAEKLEYKMVMDALERGDFYATAGPEIHELFIEDGVINVKTSPVKEVYVSTERRWRKVARASETLLTEAKLDINDWKKTNDQKYKAWKPYIRLVLVDEQGNKAYTRAYYEEELK